jgi:hypothetical protein
VVWSKFLQACSHPIHSARPLISLTAESICIRLKPSFVLDPTTRTTKCWSNGANDRTLSAIWLFTHPRIGNKDRTTVLSQKQRCLTPCVFS